MPSILDRALPDMYPDLAKLLTWPPAPRSVPLGGSASGLSHFGGPVLGQSWLSRLSEGRRRPRNNFARSPRVARGSLFNLKHNRGVLHATLAPPANTTVCGVQQPSLRVQRANRHFSQNACVKMGGKIQNMRFIPETSTQITILAQFSRWERYSSQYSSSISI